jgi:hypothetical protein
MELQDHIKPVIEHKEFTGEVRDENISVSRISHVFAVNIAFFNTNFTQCDFANCYFRNCRFIRCDFTGATIKESNFRGSQFEQCDFRYTSWEKTILDEHFLDTCLPSEENLARDLTRSLRVNFSQIGNHDAANKAASIEVSLTGQYLYNAAYSRQSYYRGKYKGWSRISHAIGHAHWKALDLLWGNGESIRRVTLSGLFAVIIVALALLMRDHSQLTLSDAIWSAFLGFWGIQGRVKLPDSYAVTLTIIRFILFGLFMAILIKRLSRR